MPDSFFHRPLGPLELIVAGTFGNYLAVMFSYTTTDFFSPYWPLSGMLPGLYIAPLTGLPMYGALAIYQQYVIRSRGGD